MVAIPKRYRGWRQYHDGTANVAGGYLSTVIDGVEVQRHAANGITTLMRQDLSSVVPVTTNTDGGVIKIGSSSTPASTPVATTAASMSMVRMIFGLDHTSSYGFYTRSYIRTASISADAARIFATVHDVAATDARALHASLSFGDSGTVSGLGAVIEATLHMKSGAGAAGTLYGVKSAIHSDAATSDPAGATTLAYYAAVNQGNTTGDDDVDTDAVLFDVQGHATGTGTLFQTVTTAYTLGEITNSLKVKVGANIYHILLSNVGAQAT